MKDKLICFDYLSGFLSFKNLSHDVVEDNHVTNAVVVNIELMTFHIGKIIM